MYKFCTHWNDIIYLGKGRSFSLGRYKESQYQENPCLVKKKKEEKKSYISYNLKKNVRANQVDEDRKVFWVEKQRRQF